MSNALPPPEPFWLTVRRVAGTRKGVAAIIATVVGSVYALALTASYLRGQMSADVYWTKLGVAGGAVTAAWMLYMPSVAYEDANKNRPGSVMAIGEGAKASSTQTNAAEPTPPSAIDVSSIHTSAAADVLMPSPVDPSTAVTPVDNPHRGSVQK
jgi:hypothetical protein